MHPHDYFRGTFHNSSLIWLLFFAQELASKMEQGVDSWSIYPVLLPSLNIHPFSFCLFFSLVSLYCAFSLYWLHSGTDKMCLDGLEYMEQRLYIRRELV